MGEINSFKDNIYKVSNGEQINSSDLEKLIETQCHYVQYVAVGNDDTENPIAFIFPNQKLLNNPDYKLSPEEGCFCPRSLNELGRCLTGCLKLVNNGIENNSSKLKEAAIIKTEVSVTNDTPTTSQEIFEKYKTLLRQTHGEQVPADAEIYFIKNGL